MPTPKVMVVCEQCHGTGERELNKSLTFTYRLFRGGTKLTARAVALRCGIGLQCSRSRLYQLKKLDLLEGGRAGKECEFWAT